MKVQEERRPHKPRNEEEEGVWSRWKTRNEGKSENRLLPGSLSLLSDWLLAGEWAELDHGERLCKGGCPGPTVQRQGDGPQRQVCDPDAGEHHL